MKGKRNLMNLLKREEHEKRFLKSLKMLLIKNINLKQPNSSVSGDSDALGRGILVFSLETKELLG